MITIEDCGDCLKKVQEQLDKACKNNDIVTDKDLRDCIKDRCEKSGTVECEFDCDDGVLGYNRWFTFFGLFKIWASSTIHLCKNNIEKYGYEDDMWKIIIHEFAHSCCWNHGDNHGVPGDDGTIGRGE